MSDREVIFTCEACCAPICEGDKYHAGEDVDLCETCAPTYRDMVNSPSHFRDGDDSEMSPALANAVYSEHIAAGGSPDDKMVTVA